MMSRRSLKVFHEAVIAQQINNLKQWIWAVMLASTIPDEGKGVEPKGSSPAFDSLPSHSKT